MLRPYSCRTVDRCSGTWSWLFRAARGRGRFRWRRLCRRLGLFLALILGLEIKGGAISVLHFVRPNVIQRRLHSSTKPVKVVLLFGRKPRPIHHQNRLKPRIRLRLTLHRKLRRTRRRILGRNRRRWRLGMNILRRRLPAERRSRDCRRRNRYRRNRCHSRRQRRPACKLPPRNRGAWLGVR